MRKFLIALSISIITLMLALTMPAFAADQTDATDLGQQRIGTVPVTDVTWSSIGTKGTTGMTAFSARKMIAHRNVAGAAQFVTSYYKLEAGDQTLLDKAMDVTYYVAQSETSVFVTVRLASPTWTVDGAEGYSNRSNYYFRIGFNPDAYEQALVLGSPVNTGAITTGTFYDARKTGNYGTVDTTVVKNSFFKAFSWDGTTEGTDRLISTNTDLTQRAVFYYAFELDKAALATAWDTAFGTSFGTNGLPNTMFFATTNSQYNRVAPTSVTPLYSASIITKTQGGSIGGNCPLLPDVIILGEEIERPGCTFDSHSTDAKYLVAGTTNTYYHSCSTCGNKGVRTFTVDTDASYYTVEDATLTGAVKIAATCESAGVGVKSCTCRELDPTATKTFTIAALGHNGETSFEKDAEGHWTVCSRCNTEGNVLPTGGVKVAHAYVNENVLDDNANLKEAGNCTKAPAYFKVCDCGAIATEAGENDANVFYDGASGHTNENRYLLKDANGHWYVCDDCKEGDTRPEGIPLVEHTLIDDATLEGTEVSAPTCTAKGEYYKSCEECKYISTETFEVDMIPHTFTDKTTKTHKATDATCTTDETYYVECAVCNLSSKGTASEETYAVAGSKDAHIAANQKTMAAKAPTCVAGGWVEYKYCDCGYSTYEQSKLAPTRWISGTKPADAIDYTALYQYGQQVYVAGSAAKVSDSLKPADLEMGLNYKKGLTFANSDEVLVDVTGEGKTVQSFVTSGGAASAMMSSAPKIATENDFVDLPEADYYVAYNSDYIFLTIREQGGTYNSINGTVLQTQRLGSIGIRIGFNPSNPAQRLTFTQNVATDIAFDGFYNGSTKVTSGFGTILERGLSRKYALPSENVDAGANGNNVGYAAKGYVTYHTIVLNKAEIANAYNAILGENTYTKETLPNTMFVSMYGTPTNQRGGGFASTTEADAPYLSASGKAFQMAYGLTALSTPINGAYAIPDMVVLGDEKDIGCEFEKSIDDNHKVTNEDGTYYYYTSCKYCDAKGAATFTKCEVEGQHSYKDMPGKAPTCNAPGYVAYKYCTVCADVSGYKVLTPTRYFDEKVTKVDHTALADYGQIVYAMGANGVLPNDFTWADLDAKASALYSLGVTNKYIASSYAGNAQSTTNTDKYYCNTPLEDQGDAVYAPDLEYLVGYNDSNIYVTFKIIGTQYLKRCNYTFRLGFNPANYAQTMVMSLGMNATGATSAFFVDDRSTSKLGENASGTADSVITNTRYARYSYDGFAEGTTMTASNGNASSQFVAYVTVEINKENLAKTWDSIYGTNFSEIGLPNTFYACGSHSALSWFDGVPAFASGATSLNVTQGAHAVTIPTANNELGTQCVLIPNVIVMGSEKQVGCNFTAHNVADKYLADAETKTYYHSCVDCGALALTTFSLLEENLCFDAENLDAGHWYKCNVCDDALVYNDGELYTVEHTYDREVVDEAYIVDKNFVPYCTKGYDFYTSCACGAHTTDNDTFEGVETRNTYNHTFTGDPTARLKNTDPQGHYYECENCKGIASFETHTINSENYCDVCGYEVEIIPGGAIGGGSAGDVTEPEDTTAPEDTTVPEDTTAPEDTDAPETSAPVVDDETTVAPETEAPVVSDDETEADTTAEETSCEGTVTFAGLALVATLGLCTTFVAKKKEEDKE